LGALLLLSMSIMPYQTRTDTSYQSILPTPKVASVYRPCNYRPIVASIYRCFASLIFFQEKTYNPYYTLILNNLCAESYDHRFTLQYALWDLIKELDTSKKGDDREKEKERSRGLRRKAGNVGRCLGYIVARGGVDITVFKVSSGFGMFFPVIWNIGGNCEIRDTRCFNAPAIWVIPVFWAPRFENASCPSFP
jgi:hypothetical protein